MKMCTLDRSHVRRMCLSVATAIGALAIGPVSGVSAESFYVSTSGSDTSGDGSAGNPFATIGHAVNRGIPAAGGHTVLVRDGTYMGTSTISRSFPATVTVRAEHPYAAKLTNVDGGREAIRFYIKGPARLVIEGFVLTNRHPDYPCDGGREPYYVMHLQDASDILVANNIFIGNNAPGTCNEILKINRSGADVYPKNITVRGNVFSEPANANGADIIDAVRPGEVDILENIFFSYPEISRSQSFITLKRQAPTTAARSPRYRISRNVFLGWGGKTDQAFIQFGEDGVPEHEITDALIENNLFIGDSPVGMAAPMQFKGARSVMVRANTAVGDLPGGSFGFRIGTEGENPTVGDIRIHNNVWSDPTGTMGRRFINAYGDVDISTFVLDRNLFWNAGNPLPSDGALMPADDLNRIVADPLLGATVLGATVAGGSAGPGEAVVLPEWDAGAGAFRSGETSIRAEFLRLIEAHGAPDADSPVVGAADAGQMPVHDIRGFARDDRPDLGAYEVGAYEAAPSPSSTSTAVMPPTAEASPTSTPSTLMPTPTRPPGSGRFTIYLPAMG